MLSAPKSVDGCPLDRWHLLLAVLIAYGTLYPFDFTLPPQPAQALYDMLTRAHLWTSRGDVLGNLALFVPWGLASAMRGAPGRKNYLALALGLAFAAIMQVMQIAVPSRDATLADVFWNGVGICVGQFALAPFVQRLRAAAYPDFLHDNALALALAALWLATQTAPFIPSLDLALIRAHGRIFLSPAEWSLAAFATNCAGVLALGHIVSRLAPARMALPALAIALAGVLCGRLIIVDNTPHWHDALGLAVGYALVAVLGEKQRIAPVAFAAMLLAMTLAELRPYQFSSQASGFGWIPFAGYLSGNMALNLRELLEISWQCAALLWLAHALNARVQGIAIFIVSWSLLLEIAQIWLPARSADLTPPLTCALAALAFMRLARRTPSQPKTETASIPARNAPDCPAPTAWQHPLPWALAGWLGATALLTWLIRLPGVPYNLRELFVGGGHPAAIALFVLALLWLGAGPRLALDRALKMRPAAPMLAALACVAGIVTFWLLSSSVTYESFLDVTGSADWTRALTETDGRGGGILRHLPMTRLERAIRFLALYLPPAALLALSLAVLEFRVRARALAFMALTFLPLLWLCKAITFDWASTDNLIELVAPHGGIFLYLLLGVATANVALMATPANRRYWPRLAFTLAALPVSWWLLTLGLDQSVEKYGHVFSGQQFLLGPDRSAALATSVLQARWAALYLTLVLSGALGVAAGRWLCVRMDDKNGRQISDRS
ncbi:MAG: VanZ family protein [Azoarcus sp.]|nr:VanZ family protein [Azoarcus sp.]